MTNNEMELLYDKYSGSVYRLAVSYFKNTADAEDIVQEVFMKLFSADMTFPDERSEKAWIMTVTANKCRDMLRSLAYKCFHHSVALEDADLIYETPEESAVYNAVMELPPKYRIVIHLYYYEGYSTAETAKIIGISETAVQTRLYRGRNLLKKSLGEDVCV